MNHNQVDWDAGASRQAKSVSFFESLKKIKFPKIFKKKPNDVYNFIVFLSSSILYKILLLCGMMATYTEYFGRDISCIIPEPKIITVKKIEDYCLSDGIFTIHNTPTYQTPLNGISSYQVNDNHKVYLRYYPWVHVACLLQAFMFYQIRSIWSRLQDSKILTIYKKIIDKDINIYELSRSERINIVQRVADLLFIGGTFYYRVIVVEFICLIHILFQIWITDIFLGGNFQYLGLKWLDYNQGQLTGEVNPLQKIFPRQAKCTFAVFGASGGLDSYDGFCLLLMNNTFEKIYIAIWLAFHVALIVNGVSLCWIGIIFSCPLVRRMSIQFSASSQAANKYRKFYRNPGNWFTLHLLSSNMTSSYFVDLMDAVMKNHFDYKGKPMYTSKYGKYAKKHVKRKDHFPLIEVTTSNNSSDYQNSKQNSNVVQWPDEDNSYVHKIDSKAPTYVPPGEWDGKVDWSNAILIR